MNHNTARKTTVRDYNGVDMIKDSSIHRKGQGIYKKYT